jgi:glycosyltransferase involved in cell wall biosynthesis
MNKLHIITRCTRPQNLVQIKQSIINGNKNTFDITWYIVFDTSVLKDIDAGLLCELNSSDIRIEYKFLASAKGAYGYDSINKIIESVPNEEPTSNDWFYLLDDDNILHEDFHELSVIIDKGDKLSSSNTSELGVIVFNQYIGGKDFSKLEYRIAAKENTKIGGIDAAQYIARRRMISWPTGLGYSLDYCADGMLMNFLLTVFEDSFLFVDKVYSYYNHIESEKKNFSLPKVLVIGLEEPITMESTQYVDYEAKELNAKFIIDDKHLDSVLQKFNPDAIVTLGNKYDRFNKLSGKHVDLRKRWIHYDIYDDTIGEKAYQCANSYILDGNKDEDNPLVSFFTPFHNTGDKLNRTYDSLRKQTYINWEWVLVNDSSDNGKTLKIAEEIAINDCRVKIYDFREKSGGVVGESKYRAAMLSKGQYLMELDHDDCLTEDAAELMVKAFKKYPDCKFVYSDCAEIWEDHSCIKYGDGFAFGYGSYRQEVYNGRTYDVANTSNINPKTIRHIVGVPNHFRAWDADFYRSIGGHNRRLTIADDYELIVRTFLKTRMVRIPKMLYLQFYHNSNTQNLTRADIQRRVKSIRYSYNEKINQRFIELGVIDWAYDYNNVDPLYAPSLFGSDENPVNYIMKLELPKINVINNSKLTYLI